ncbi:MAG: CBS domain-containing protein [Kofleriaceae bacterium]
MNVEDLMTKNVVTCFRTDCLATAAQKMWDGDCGALPVVDDDGALVGMVTDRDICMAAWTRGALLAEITVEQAMASDVFSIAPDQDTGFAELLMAEKQIRRIPVVDKSHNPIGILSMNDLAREAARPASELMDGPARVVHTMASICRPRRRVARAA